jgi:hypothetical protein
MSNDELATLERQLAHLEQTVLFEESRLEAVRPYGVRRRGFLPGIVVGFLLVGLLVAGAAYVAFAAIMSMD